MAFIAVTYTFSNGSTSDASQINQNYTDLVNGLSDGTKDISVSAGTFAGNVSISGNTTIGNASGDDLTVTASLASSIPIKTTNSYDIGSSTLGLRALYFGANSQTVKIQGSSSMSATWTLTLPVSAGTDGYYLKTNGSGVASWQAFTTPTVQTFTSGSGTYTTPANVKYIRVRIVGGGGGGSGGGSGSPGAGGNGGTSTFGSSLLSAGGGDGAGATSGGGGAGGTYTLNSPAIGSGFVGGSGSGHDFNSGSTSTQGAGSQGGDSYFGGGGGGGNYNGGGTAGSTNTGGGGGGGGCQTDTNGFGGSGGGAGATIDAIIPAPSATYSYAVGAAGSAGSAGTTGSAGGAGGAGRIEVVEYYS